MSEQSLDKSPSEAWQEVKGKQWGNHLFKPSKPEAPRQIKTYKRMVKGPFIIEDPFLEPYLDGIDKGDKDMKLDEGKPLELEDDARLEISYVGMGKRKFVDLPEDFEFPVMVNFNGRRVLGKIKKGYLTGKKQTNPNQLTLA